MTAIERVLGTILCALAAPVAAGEFKLMGFAAYEARAFLESPGFAGQHGLNNAFALQPEFYYESASARDSVLLTPFVRLDQGDSRRTHGDVREFTWVHAADNWEFRSGIRQVFWGVAESNHLIDIVNQTDLVENLDTEDKLGQPMLNVALIRSWGTLDFFVLPGFRDRTFPGKSGRLRSEPRVDTSSAQFESAAGRKHVDYAVRYSHVLGDLDIGLSHFWGTTREPELRPRLTEALSPVLAPYYALIHQTSIDALYTVGSTAFKLEALRRAGQGATFHALVGGFEHTLVGAFETTWDLGLLAEYHGDDRGRRATQPFNHDLFVGLRLSLNDEVDSQLLTGVIADLHGEGRFFNLETSRRVGERWKVEAEARIFWSATPGQTLFFVERDDYLQISLSRYF